MGMSFARKIVKIQKIGYIYFYHISRKPITACKLGQLIEPKYLNKTWWNRLSFTTDVLYSELLSILSHLFWRWQVHSSSPSFLLQHFPRISFSFPLGWCCLTTHRLWHCSCIFLMFFLVLLTRVPCIVFYHRLLFQLQVWVSHKQTLIWDQAWS